MIKPRYLMSLYAGKQITDLDYGEKIDDIVYFSTTNINRIAIYERFRQIDFDHKHAHHRYLKYKKEGLIDKKVSKKPSKGLVFALTEKGEQYCKRKINDYLIRVAGKTPKIVSLPSDFDELREKLPNYGLNWLANDHFEFHKHKQLHLDKWKKGFEFDLPSIKSRQELRREVIIRDIKTKLENEKRILIVGPSGSSKSTILMELMCDYFDAGYEIFHNKGFSEGVKNPDGLVNFIELIKIDPGGWLDVWISKGSLHALLNNYKEAADCYDRALKINSNLADIWFHKGVALARLDRNDDAQFCFGKAEKLGFNIDSLKRES